ncbi:MAG: hypothetical protein LBI34_00045 [Puniceicoccales bacterium]|jgi:hypothetical protein|nr:hypothetical protein [Puniceicoccales bacterium]
MTMEWTLTYDGVTQTFARWGIGDTRRHRINQGRDVLTFRHTAPEALTDGPIFAPLAPIQVYCDGSRWFHGVVTEVPSFGDGSDESKYYKVSGPWWYLETTIYQQPWAIAADPNDPNSPITSVYKSHIILGQSEEGEVLSIGNQLMDIFNYALICAVPICIGEINFPQTVPFDECKDLSCAEAIQRILRWIPDAIIWFDYGTTSPTLHIARRRDMPSLVYAVDSSLNSISISPRYDLMLRGVAIKYERVHSVSGRTWRTLETDRYPTNISELQPQILVLTVELAGTRSQYVSQSIVADEVDPGNASWWQGHLPALATLDPSAITILSHGRDSALPRELRSGGVADWMSVAVESDVVRATLAYEDGATGVAQQTVAVKIKATDATSQTYARLSSFTDAEESPIGLARAIYESFSNLTFEGTLQLLGEEIASVPMGVRLNLTGGNILWGTMDAQIQECIEHLDSGTVRLRFGSAKHLGMKDLIQLSRVNRRREAPRSTYIRTNGEGSDEHIEQARETPGENTHTGTTTYSHLLLADVMDGTRQIVLDARQIGLTGLVLRVREEDVCENGILKKRLILASQPYALSGDEL